MKSITEQGFIHEFTYDYKAQHSSNFESVENVRSSNVVELEFELRHMSIKESILSMHQHRQEHLTVISVTIS